LISHGENNILDWGEVAGDWRKLHVKGLLILQPSTDTMTEFFLWRLTVGRVF